MLRLLICAILLLPLGLIGQKNYFGFQIGLNGNGVHDPELEDQLDPSHLGLLVGVEAIIPFRKNLYYRMGLFYDERGMAYEAELRDTNGNEQGTASLLIDRQYLTVPVLFGFRSKGDLAFFIELGVATSFLIGARREVFTQTGFSNTYKENGYDYFNKIDLCGQGGFGLSYQLNPSLRLSASTQTLFGVIPFSRDPSVYGTRATHEGSSIKVGLHFRLP